MQKYKTKIQWVNFIFSFNFTCFVFLHHVMGKVKLRENISVLTAKVYQCFMLENFSLLLINY